jgi:chromosome segregation ATPase
MNEPRTPNPKPVHDLARLAYLQGLFVHRRVLLVSDNPAVLDFLIERRARYVCAVSENEAAAASWPAVDGGQEREIKSMPLSDLAFRDGMFDLVLVTDLTTVREPAAFLNEARRVVGPRGHVAVASPNPGCDMPVGPPAAAPPLDYYELYDLLSAAFDSVQMIGVSGFLGYQVSDLGAADEDPAIAFDGTLLGEASEEIEWFLALCGSEQAQADPLAVIQIPLGSGQTGGTRIAGLEVELERARGELAELDGRLRETRLELGTRGVRIETLEKEVEHERLRAEEARARAVQIAKQHDDERKAQQAKRLDEEMGRRAAEAEVQGRLRQAELRLRQAEARAESAEASRDGLVERRREDGAELDRLREQVENLERTREAAERREHDLAMELEGLRREAERAGARERNLEAEVGQRSVEIEDLRGQVAGLAGAGEERRAVLERELLELERRLEELGSSRREANLEVDRRERIIRDLVVQIEDGAARLGVAHEEAGALELRLREQDDARREQERLVARLESELQAATWRTAELEARARDADGLASAAGQRADETARELAPLREELAAAIDTASQHHRARVEAELQLATAQLEHERLDAELSDFIARTRELEERLSALQGAASGHHRARIEARLEVATAEAEAERARADLALERERSGRLEESLTGLRAELECARAERGELERRLAESIAEARGLRSELDHAHGLAGQLEGVDQQVSRLREELDVQRLRVAELEGDVERRESERSRIEAELDRTRGDLGAALRREAEASREGEERTVRLASVERHVRQTEDEGDRLREQARRVEDELGLYRERATSLAASLAAASGDRDRLEREVGELCARLEGAARAGGEHAAQQEQDRARAEAAEQALGAARAELEGAWAHIESAARERDETRRLHEAELEEARRLAQRFAERLEELERSREQATSAERELTRLERERDETAELLEQERGTARGLSAAVALARAEAAEERERTGLAGADAARLAGNLADVQARLAERERELEQRAGETDAAERGLLALRDEVARLGEQLEEARESRRAEQVRGRSLLEEVERLSVVEVELDAARERLSVAETEIAEARAAQQERLEAATAAARQATAAGQDLADRTRRLEGLERDLGAAKEEIGRLSGELARAGTDTQSAHELVELRLTAARQVEEISRLQEEARQRDPLLESLTAQLEERERRAASLERKAKQLEERCKEHESDGAAWDTELKFRTARIAQLEDELRALGYRATAGGSADAGRMPPPAGESPLVLKKQISDLHDELGDREAELLLIHTRAEEAKLKLERTRKALQNLLGAGQIGSATAVQIHDIIISMERGSG